MGDYWDLGHFSDSLRSFFDRVLEPIPSRRWRLSDIQNCIWYQFEYDSLPLISVSSTSSIGSSLGSGRQSGRTLFSTLKSLTGKIEGSGRFRLTSKTDPADTNPFCERNVLTLNGLSHLPVEKFKLQEQERPLNSPTTFHFPSNPADFFKGEPDQGIENTEPSQVTCPVSEVSEKVESNIEELLARLELKEGPTFRKNSETRARAESWSEAESIPRFDDSGNVVRIQERVISKSPNPGLKGTVKNFYARLKKGKTKPETEPVKKKNSETLRKNWNQSVLMEHPRLQRYDTS